MGARHMFFLEGGVRFVHLYHRYELKRKLLPGLLCMVQCFVDLLFCQLLAISQDENILELHP